MDFSMFGITPDQVEQFRKFMAEQQQQLTKVAADNKSMEEEEKMDTGAAASSKQEGEGALLQVNKSVHAGVFCEICKLEVKGARFQCMECDNYDLCSGCEQKGHRAGHVMMRISFPEQTPPQFAMKDSEEEEDEVAAAAVGDEENAEQKTGGRQSREYSRWMKRGAIHQQRSEKAYARAAAAATSAEKGGRRFASSAPRTAGQGPSVDFAAVATAGIQRFLGNWGVPTDPKELYGNFMAGTGPFAALQALQAKKDETKTEDGANKQDDSKTGGAAGGNSQEASKPGDAPADWNELFTKTLNQLIRMGFSNDKGYLTKLITDHKGDLGAVLGALFPN